jgi:hypothetical protein
MAELTRMARPSKQPIKDWFAIFAADLAMDWRQWTGIAAVAAVAVVLGVYLVGITRGTAIRSANWGFGPEWDCGNPVKASDLVCIKTTKPKPD